MANDNNIQPVADHIRNIFKEKELDENKYVRKPYILPQTAKDIVLKSIIWML
ncbi:hypothetical protein ACQRC7_03500 [Segatella copri]|uniref:hypothetical protein n=1 Tax=Segatella copri TaxID=165179 RepID=UPI003D0307D2